MREILSPKLTYTQLRILILIFFLLVLAIYWFVFSRIFTSRSLSNRRISKIMIKQECQLGVEFKRAEGNYMIYQMSDELAQIRYLQQADDETITSATLQTSGYYLGSIMPNTEFYISISDSMYTAGRTFMYLTAISPTCKTAFLKTEIPSSVEACVNNKIFRRDIEDYSNGCLRITYNLEGFGDVYGYYRAPSENGKPDELVVYNEGMYLGRFNNEPVEAIYCGLYDNSTYEFYLVSKVSNCISKPDFYQYKTQILSEEAKWGAGAIKHIQIQHSTHIGINYRSFGGVEVTANLPTTGLSEGGVILKQEGEDTEPIIVSDTDMKCSEPNEYVIKIRSALKKKNKVVIKLMILGRGNLYVYYTAEKTKKIESEVVVSKGKFLGYYSDEFAFIRLNHIPDKPINVHFVMVCKSVVTPPFTKLVV